MQLLWRKMGVYPKSRVRKKRSEWDRRRGLVGSQSFLLSVAVYDNAKDDDLDRLYPSSLMRGRDILQVA